MATEENERQISWSTIFAGASVLVSLASAHFAYLSAESAAAANLLAKAVQDRAAGKIKAQFEFVKEREPNPDRHKAFMRTKDRSNEKIFRMESADDLVRWSPRIKIKNNGEPIDAIKISVRYEIGAAYGEAVEQIEPAPVVIADASTYEMTSFGKLGTGQFAKIFIAPTILDQIMRLEFSDFADQDHVGIFSVNAQCRLVGSSSYDRASDEQSVGISFHWRPAGFKSENKRVKQLLEKKPWIEID